MRLEIRKKEINLGDRIVLSAGDFDKIALGCFSFGSQLADHLPQPVNV
jgi:hypothetical protein